MVLEDYKTVKIPDLHPDGKYTFTIRRVAEDGRQSIATSLWAKTDVGSPKHVKVDHISHDSLFVCWAPPGGEVRNYTVTCSKGQQVVKKSTTTETSIRVMGLKPNTLYTFEVSAEFMNGNKSEPAETQATTDVESPKQIKVDQVSHDSLSVCWTPPGGEVRNYTVTCHKQQQIVKTLTTTSTNITVTDLEAETCYTLKVSAEFVNGKISKSVSTWAYTDVESPKQMGVDHVSHDSLSVCWTPPGGEVRNYIVTCRKGQQIVKTLTTISTKATVTDLEQDTCYNLEVSAEFVNGKISKPALTQAYTDDGSPKRIKVDRTSHDSLSVCWTPPGGEVRNYTVACRNEQQIVQSLTTTDTNITVTELEPDTLYILEVSAKFMNGKKSKPAITQATTDVESPKHVEVYVSHDSLSVCWTPPGGEVKNYTLTCCKGQQIVQNLTTTETNITVTDLNSGTSYNLEVCAEFVNGKISKPASTQANTDVESPKQVKVNRTSHDSLFVCWTPPGGEVRNYTVACHKGQQIVQNLKTRETNITIRDLEPDTCYTLEVSAVFLNKKISKPASTEATTDVESPKQMGVYRISHDSLSVCWTPPGGEVRNYTVISRKGEEVVKNLTTTETNISVTDLDPGTCYTLEVSTEFVNGKISKPASTQAYTDDGSPKRIKVDHTSHDSLSVCWTPPGGEVRNYTVTCQNGLQFMKILTTTDTNIRVTGLEPDTCYTLNVSAEFMNGTKGNPAVTQATTDVESPKQIRVCRISSFSLFVSWTPPAGGVRSYTVTCRKEQQIVKKLTTTDTSITVTDLEPRMCYILEISAEFADGKISKPALTQGYTGILPSSWVFRKKTLESQLNK